MSPLLNAEQAAALLNIPKSWLLAQAREDKVPHVRLGRYIRFDAQALEEWARQAARGPRRKGRHDPRSLLTQRAREVCVLTAPVGSKEHNKRWGGAALTARPRTRRY
jgi:excisionase family DNA binding protein